jgi:hypothetical protein
VVRLWPKAGIALVSLAALLLFIAAGRHMGSSRGRPPVDRTAAPPAEPRQDAGVPGMAVNTPRVYTADQVNLGDKETVIGVSVNGRHRAYRLVALGGLPMAHVVNDLFGDVPVSIAHCDRVNCTQVVTAATRGAPLHLGLGGYVPQQMLLRAEGVNYFEDSLLPVRVDDPPFPYQKVEFAYTAWMEWREAHPDTEVYVGTDPPSGVLR